MKYYFKDFYFLTIATIILTFLVWLPHLAKVENFYGLNFSEGFNTIYRNYDGIEYVYIAKSFYVPELISNLSINFPASYFPAHFPLYSIFILIFSSIIGYLKSMLLVTLLFSIGAVLAFYTLAREFKLTNNPLFLSLIFLILPARWLVVHSVGSSEPTFIFFIILSIYFFLKYERGIFVHLKLKDQPKNFKFLLLSGIFGMLAVLTRPPGVLLFISFGLFILWQKILYPAIKEKPQLLGRVLQNTFFAFKQYYPLGLMPFGLVLVFGWYQIAVGDFFAYFKTGDNIHLFFPPYQVFNNTQYWVGDIWLEDIVYIYLLGFLSSIYLFRQKLNLFGFFILTYFIASSMVAHRDISRYTLPAFPFMLIAFEKVLTSKEFKIVMVILALAIYLYTQNFILSNTAPIENPQIFD